MKLIYHIPDKLYCIQNFLDFNSYKNIHNAIFTERKKINLSSVKDTWQEGLIKNIKPPKKVDIINYPPFEKLKILTQHNQFYKLNSKRVSTSIHYMEKGSGINWHNDKGWKYGATYYLNNRWNNHFGGEFMFRNENGHGFIPVVGNSLVIIKAPLIHKVNPILSPLVPRISIQMFMK
jgi:Rps23 Pro-64 3,4-dihydroxylase Tpa1-like proline 4-hydroxylase